MYRNAAGIGADIGHSSIKTGIVRIDGSIFHEETKPLPKRQNKDQIIELLSAALNRTRLKAAESGINTISVGISARGFVDHQSGIVLGPDHGITGWSDVPLSKLVAKEVGLPVYVGNDANLMTVAEHHFGAARGYRNVVFVALRTGIGGGLIVNGNLYRGINNAGGEIGQMIINFSGGTSETGIRGSLEYYASGSALVRRYGEETGKLDKRGAGISANEIFNLSAKGDRDAVRVVNENASFVGIGLANLVTIFAPEIIVLGGGMAEAGAAYIDMIRESAFINSLENCRAKVIIEKATLGAGAALIGAGYYSLIRLAGKSI